MKYTLLLFLFFQFNSPDLNAQFSEKGGAISAQIGPETGMSLIMPKIAYRTHNSGLYFGGMLSVFLVGTSAFSFGGIIGYRKGGLAIENSLAFTYCSGEYDGGKNPSGEWININPKIIIGHKAFVGFGPAFYLKRPKYLTNTLWDDVGKYNFELGHSDLFQF